MPSQKKEQVLPYAVEEQKKLLLIMAAVQVGWGWSDDGVTGMRCTCRS